MLNQRNAQRQVFNRFKMQDQSQCDNKGSDLSIGFIKRSFENNFRLKQSMLANKKDTQMSENNNQE